MRVEIRSLAIGGDDVHVAENFLGGMHSALPDVFQALFKDSAALRGVRVEPGGFVGTVREGFDGLLDEVFGRWRRVVLFVGDDLGAAWGARGA